MILLRVGLFFISVIFCGSICYTQTLNNLKLSDSLNSLLNQAVYYAEVESNDELSFKKMLEAERLSRDYPNLKKSFLKAMTNLVRGRALYNLGDLDKSDAYADKGLQNAEACDSKILQSFFYALKGNISITRKAYEKAKEFHLKAIQVIQNETVEYDKRFTAVSLDVHKIDVYYSLADLEYRPFLNWRFELNELEKDLLNKTLNRAKKYATKTIEYINRTGTRFSRKKYMYVIIGQSFIEEKNLEKAKIYLDSLKQIVKHKDYLNQFRLNYTYGNYYQKYGDFNEASLHYKKAYQFSRKYSDYNFSKFDNRLNNEIEYLTEGLEGELLKTEIDLKKTERFKNIIFLTLIGLTILSLFVFSILQMKLLKMKSKSNRILIKKNEELNNMIEGKLKLENKINNIQDVIARDLHDNFGNRIAGINSASNILKDLKKDKKYSSQEFEDFLDHLNNGVMHLNADIKDLLWANNSKNNLFSEVIMRLELFVNEFKKTVDCTIKFEKNIGEDYILPRFWNRQILLIFKEAINNACKHTKCKSIVINIEAKNNKIEIRAKNQGFGFDVSKVKRKSGLNNMVKRAESIGCKLIINSSLGNGTEISFTGIIDDYSKSTI